MKRNLKSETREMFNNRYGQLDSVIYGDFDFACDDNCDDDSDDDSDDEYDDEPDEGSEDYVAYHLRKVVMCHDDLRSYFKDTVINDHKYYTADEVFVSVQHIVKAYPELQNELDNMGLDLLAVKELHPLLDLLSESCPNYKKLTALPIHINDLYPDLGDAMVQISYCNYSAEELYESAKLIIEVFPEAQDDLNCAAEYLLDMGNTSLVLSLVTEHNICAKTCIELFKNRIQNGDTDTIGKELIFMVNNLKKMGLFDSLKDELKEIAAVVSLIDRVENDSVDQSIEITKLFGLDKEMYILGLNTYKKMLEDTDFNVKDMIAIASIL